MKTCIAILLSVVVFFAATGNVNDLTPQVRGFRPLDPVAKVRHQTREFRPLTDAEADAFQAKLLGVSDSTRNTNNNVARLVALVKAGTIRAVLNTEQMRALILTESSGRNGLVGDKHLGSSKEWAWGVLQIRQCYVDDVNARFGTDIRATDCQWNIELSKLVTQAYLNIYAAEKSFEQRARIHNGGPKGYDPKHRTYTKTTEYWKKVQTNFAHVAQQ